MADSWIKTIGQNRGAPRIFLDGLQAARAGFSPGDRFDIEVNSDRLTLSARKDGSRIVSRRTGKGGDQAVIDINNKALLALFDGMSAVRVVVHADCVYFLPLASEIHKKERLQRITKKMQTGDPLMTGSLSHGGGILTHAIHAGLRRAGMDASLAFANEIREDLIEQAATHNDAWSDSTQILNMPMQELAQDEWLLKSLPKLDILEMGLPCSGASRAGKSKRGLTMMEDHPEVGHLVVAALMILQRTQPVYVVLENVPDYASSASAQILRRQLRDMGYDTCEAILSGRDFGCLENRVRWCLVAHTAGTTFSFDQIQPALTVVRELREFLDAVPLDDPSWREVRYLKDKAVRDRAEGKGFAMQMITASSTSVPTLRKGYAKGGSTDPRVQHPDNPNLSRLLTAAEHARIKGVSPSQIEGMSETLAHQELGQGIVYEPFEAVGKRIGDHLEALRKRMFPAIEAQNSLETSDDDDGMGTQPGLGR